MGAALAFAPSTQGDSERSCRHTCLCDSSGTTPVGTERSAEIRLGNVWCEAHEHVRQNKLIKDEEQVAGRNVDETGVKPGCELSIQAFSGRPNTIRVWRSAP